MAHILADRSLYIAEIAYKALKAIHIAWVALALAESATKIAEIA
jgi:hypothetical protein